jgi:hypothetical protein
VADRGHERLPDREILVLAAEQAGERRAGYRGRQVAGELRHPRVAGHDGQRADPDRRLKRRQVGQSQLGQAAFDGGDGLVGQARAALLASVADPR